MSSDNAMTRFKKMLDERGMKHVGANGTTRFTNKDGYECRAYGLYDVTKLDVTMMDVTPERAIEATLGSDEADTDLEAEVAHCEEVIAALKRENERLKSMVQLFGTY